MFWQRALGLPAHRSVRDPYRAIKDTHVPQPVPSGTIFHRVTSWGDVKDWRYIVDFQSLLGIRRDRIG
jgi:hypothetical protein